MNIQQLPVFYLGHLADALEEHALSIEHLLKQDGYSYESIFRLDSQLSTQQFDSLLNKILNYRSTQHLGLSVGRRLKIAHHGAFGLAILNSHTIRDIVDFVKEYISIRIPYIEISVIEGEDIFTIVANDLHWEGAHHRFIIEAVSMAMLNLFFALKERENSLSIKQLFFDFDVPDYFEKYSVFDPIALKFNHAFCGIVLDKKWIDKKLNGSDSLSYQQAVQLCDDEKQRHQLKLSISGRVWEYILKQERYLPNLNDVAKQMNVSSRTLHRELLKENTSFKKIMEQYQAKKSKELLLAYQYSVQDVAEFLGYSDVANYRRAFKRWYGCTPSDFVKRSTQSK